MSINGPRIIATRRIAQVFFFVVFLWFCLVSTVGERWWQLRGWPVNWFLELDPLAALGTALTTNTLFAGLLWALVTVALTVFLGRVFCGWICPFGALHQLVGWLGRRGRKYSERVALNQYRRGQVIKYYLLIAMLGAAAGNFVARAIRLPHESFSAQSAIILAIIAALVWLVRPAIAKGRSALGIVVAFMVTWFCLGLLFRPVTASLQTGLLDPIPLMHRSINLTVLGALGGAGPRVYGAAAGIGGLFLAAVLLNLWIPRFYCRFICPLGALFGALVRWTPWRIGKRAGECSGCELCEDNCEGACDPFQAIRLSECLMCLNCLRACRQAQMTYGRERSAAGEIARTGISRRGFVAAAVSGIAAVPIVRAAGLADSGWNPAVVRPPGALAEKEFLDRCLKCGQCMRVCPTNVVQPASLEAGLEGLWTPILNFRAGTSGCQLNCVACGNVCPTAALRPLNLDEKLGRGQFADAGPIRMGTAFVDRGRCLPWSMDVPCIVCQENCPVSPKAIYVHEEFQTIRDGSRKVTSALGDSVTVDGSPWPGNELGTGDYYLRLTDAAAQTRRLISEISGNAITLAATAARVPVVPGASPGPTAGEPGEPEESSPATQSPSILGGAVVPGAGVLIEVRLQRPVVDPQHCIGCGVCQHECPVSGLRAIRVTAENESRNKTHSLTARA